MEQAVQQPAARGAAVVAAGGRLAAGRFRSAAARFDHRSAAGRLGADRLAAARRASVAAALEHAAQPAAAMAAAGVRFAARRLGSTAGRLDRSTAARFDATTATTIDHPVQQTGIGAARNEQQRRAQQGGHGSTNHWEDSFNKRGRIYTLVPEGQFSRGHASGVQSRRQLQPSGNVAENFPLGICIAIVGLNPAD